VIADPRSFTVWVSGTRAVRAADPRWPAVGAYLRHTWGPWPLRIHDRTTVLASRAPLVLELRARVRPLAVVRAWVRLSAIATGTVIELGEDVESGIATVLPAVTRAVQLRRNRRSLQALIGLAEGPNP
jgi:hypothetical protein